MEKNRVLKGNEIYLNKEQLEKYIEQLSIEQIVSKKSQKQTYPITQLKNDFQYISKVYELLNENIKQNIAIHPAGEWLLDNFYIIEETVKQIQKELTLKKYINFVGIQNGQYKGFARVYVLASEIVAYTDNKIERQDLEDYLISYQKNKLLSMEEIWNIGLFLQIAIIENIREICEKIYSSQMQKYRAENIVERLIDNKEKQEQKFKEKRI